MIAKIFQQLHYWPAYLLLKLVYRMKIEGRENLKGLEKGPVIFASNHASFMDPPACAVSLPRQKIVPGDFFPVRFIAKKDVLGGWRKNFPVAFSVLWLPVSFFSELFVILAGSIQVSRGLGVEKNLENAVEALQKNHKLWIYPEGRVTKDGNLQPARPGVVYLHQQTKAPIVPVGICGTYKGLYPKNIVKGIFGRQKIIIRFGRPFYLPDGVDFEKGSELVMAEIGRLLS